LIPGPIVVEIEIFNTIISGAMELYSWILTSSLKSLQKTPEMTMGVAKKIARQGGHLKSARAIMRSQHSAAALTRNTIDSLASADKIFGKALLVADIAWSFGENLLSGEESWFSDTIVDAGIASAVYGLSLLPGGFFISLAATAALYIYDDEIEAFKDWFYDGWSDFWSFSWI
jgi:hypothetical protein